MRRRFKRSRRRFKRRSRRTFKKRSRSRKWAGYKITSIKRSINTTYTGPTASAPNGVGGANYYTLADVPNVGEFLNLFDNFRITGIKLKFFPPWIDSTSTSTNIGQFYYAFDNDSAAAPTSITDLQQYPNHHSRSLNSQPFTFFFRPRAVNLLSTSSVYGIAPKGQWVDTVSSSGAQYFGFRWWWQETGGISTYSLTMPVEQTYYLQFKGLR